MALNIPSPHEANFGGGLFEALMQGKQAKLQRDQLAQQQQQFAQQQALQQAQEARAQELFPYQLSGMRADQAYKQSQADLAMQDQLLTQALLSGQLPQNMGGVGTMGTAGTQGNALQFGGNYTNQGGATGGNPIDMAQLAKNPMLAEFIKKRTKMDPYAESPQMKSDREFEDFQRKEKYKQESPLDIPTSTNTTLLQKVVFSSDNLLPDLKKLTEIKAPGYGGLFNPSAHAKYQGVITSALDNMLGAYGLSATDANVKSMRHLLEREFGETDSAYKDRIKEVIKDVKERQKAASNILSGKKVEITPRTIVLTEKDL